MRKINRFATVWRSINAGWDFAFLHPRPPQKNLPMGGLGGHQKIVLPDGCELRGVGELILYYIDFFAPYFY